ncbi:MAG: hypothetical protein Q4P36_08560 [Bowdeniella nasicola]|nr:hypothetical protein [Bowdeniella nasicola]
MTPDDVLPQVGYPWPYLVAGLLALSVAALIVWLARPRDPAASRSRSGPRSLTGRRRRGYATRVARLEESWRVGELDVRTLHLDAARLAREFGSEITGRDLTSVTLAQLRLQPDIAEIAAVVDAAERPSFDLLPGERAERVLEALETMVAMPDPALPYAQGEEPAP